MKERKINHKNTLESIRSRKPAKEGSPCGKDVKRERAKEGEFAEQVNEHFILHCLPPLREICQLEIDTLEPSLSGNAAAEEVYQSSTGFRGGATLAPVVYIKGQER